VLDAGYSKLETNLGHRQASIEVYPPEAESRCENRDSFSYTEAAEYSFQNLVVKPPTFGLPDI